MHKIYSAASNLKFANRMNRTQWQPKSRVKLHFQIGGISIVFVQIGRILTCLEIIQNSAPCDQDRFKLVVLNKSFPSLWIWCYFRKRVLLPNLIQNCHNPKGHSNQKHQQRAAIWVLIKGYLINIFTYHRKEFKPAYLTFTKSQCKRLNLSTCGRKYTFENTQ